MPSSTANGVNGTNGHSAPSKAFPFFNNSPDTTIPSWIDGEQVTSSSSSTHGVTSPLTNERLHRASCATEADVDRALAAAARALPGWRKTLATEKRDLLLRAADLLESWREEAWEVSRRETGAPRSHFDFDFGDTLGSVRSVAGLIEVVATGTLPAHLAHPDRHAMLIQEPYGVVFGIAPWNAPYILGTRAVVGPIAMGNTVILKGPEQSPGVYWLFTKALHDAGLPPGVLSTIFFNPTTAGALTTRVISSPTVKKINYTGSTAVGALVAATAGKHLKPILMELGGKAPAIVCADADLEVAATHCALGAFLYAGQICMSTERILVHAAVADAFRAKLAEKIDRLFGAATDDLHLVAPAAVAKNVGLVRDALGKGASRAYGGIAEDEGESEDGEANKKKKEKRLATTMRPIVVEGVREGMDLYRTESFGPTVSLIVVAGDEEALAAANDTEYGLSSSVFTADLARGFRLARGIETGAVHINSMSVHDEPALPHGGAKSSGWGRFNGVEGLREWVRVKTVTWGE